MSSSTSDPEPVGEENAAPFDPDELIYWVHTTLLPLVERSPRAAVWCPRWWEHPEALYRLELVRRAWEIAVCSDDPTDLSAWMLHHADPHLGVLLGSTGPFAECAWNPRRGYAQPHQPAGLPLQWPADFDYSRFPALNPPSAPT